MLAIVASILCFIALLFFSHKGCEALVGICGIILIVLAMIMAAILLIGLILAGKDFIQNIYNATKGL